MSLVASNKQYTLLSNAQSTLLFSKSLELVGTYSSSCKKGALQYGTGIAALCFGSKAILYDFKYNKQVYEWDSYQKILKVSLLKNLLILISSQRILIHDMSKKQNQCYIPVLQGELAFISPDYYELKIMYQLDNMQVCCRSIWLNQLDKIEGVKYQYGCFSRDGLLACLALENVLSLYRGDQMVKVYGLESVVRSLSAGPNYFFALLQDGVIVACDLNSSSALFDRYPLQLPLEIVEHESFVFDGVTSKGLECVYLLKQCQLFCYQYNKSIDYNDYATQLRVERERKYLEQSQSSHRSF